MARENQGEGLNERIELFVVSMTGASSGVEGYFKAAQRLGFHALPACTQTPYQGGGDELQRVIVSKTVQNSAFRRLSFLPVAPAVLVLSGGEQ